MSILAKLWTAVRGEANEVGQAIVDSKALTILDQEIRDAETALGTARDQLAKLIAARTLAERKVAELEAKIAEYEGHAGQALDKGDEALATDIAQRIAQWENEKGAQVQIVASSKAAEDTMRGTISATQNKIGATKREVDSVKATEAVQKAQAAVSAKHAGVNSSLGDATASLERIKTRQAERGARMAAAEELDKASTGADLDDRLAKLGIGGGATSGNDVLARIRAKKG